MAVDYYLKIDGVAGLSKSMQGYIDIVSWNWGVSNPTMRGRGTYAQHAEGKASFQDFTIIKVVDPTTPNIVSNMFKGQHIKNAQLIARRTGTTGGTPQQFLEIKFEDLLVSSHHFSGSTEGAMIEESITFRFRKIYFSASALKEGADQGAKHAGWDLNRQVTY